MKISIKGDSISLHNRTKPLELSALFLSVRNVNHRKFQEYNMSKTVLSRKNVESYIIYCSYDSLRLWYRSTTYQSSNQ